MTVPTTEAIASSRPRRRRPGPFGLIREGLSELFGRRRLTRYLVGADIKRTHSDTALGQLWWVIDPLLQMAVYIILVTIIFQRPTPDYALFIFAAILPWKWFTTTLNDATLSVTGRQGLIRQIQFPKIVLPSAAVIAGTWSFMFGLIALGLVYLFYLDRLTLWVLAIPVIAAVQFLFTMALGILLSSLNAFFRDIQNVLRHALRLWFYLDRLTLWVLAIPVIAAVQFLFTMALGILLSSLNAFFRDIQNVLRHALRLWFYLSPALYSLSAVAKGHPTIHTLLKLNPFAVLFDSYRAVIWGSEPAANVFLPPGPPDWLGLLALTGFSAVFLLFGILIFKRAEPAFARIL